MASSTVRADTLPWAAFRDRFVSIDGRVVDTGNRNKSHSEGQGYALLFALDADDRQSFERIWEWTRNNLQIRKDDALLAWSWLPEGPAGRVIDPNNASDGDILVAWALAQAGERWNVSAYREDALRIAQDIERILLRNWDGETYLLPGAEGFEKDAGIVVNPSYWIWPAFETFYRLTNAPAWKALERSGRELLLKARFGSLQLPTDWILVGPDGRVSAYSPTFGFDAIRVPLYLAWHDRGSGLLVPFREAWRRYDDRPFIPAKIQVFSLEEAPYGLSRGGRAVVAVATSGKVPEELLLGEETDYYSASLLLLSLLAAR